MAIADVGRDGEIRYFGEIDSSPTTIEKVIGKLAGRFICSRLPYRLDGRKQFLAQLDSELSSLLDCLRHAEHDVQN